MDTQPRRFKWRCTGLITGIILGEKTETIPREQPIKKYISAETIKPFVCIFIESLKYKYEGLNFIPNRAYIAISL